MTFGIIFPGHSAEAEDTPEYNAQGRRDPFVPLVSMTDRQVSGLMGIETAEDIDIEGVVYDPKKGSVVIVNGVVLKEGEEMGNLRVVKIRPDGALFSISGMEVHKALYQSSSETGLAE